MSKVAQYLAQYLCTLPLHCTSALYLRTVPPHCTSAQYLRTVPQNTNLNRLLRGEGVTRVPRGAQLLRVIPGPKKYSLGRSKKLEVEKSVFRGRTSRFIEGTSVVSKNCQLGTQKRDLYLPLRPSIVPKTQQARGTQ